jgi:RNA polymerase sigma-70 factor (ECF subfamily)
MNYRVLAEAQTPFVEAAHERESYLTTRDTDLLAERLQSGCVEALAEAYDRYHVQLRAFTQRLLGDDATAEDLVQETFVVFFRAVRRYDGTCSLKTFLLSIAVNRARQHFRTAARRRAAMERFRANEVGPLTPEEELGRNLWADELSRLLERLPADQRVAFVLCEVEGRTGTEAATIVGVPDATMRSRLWHAKKKLRRELSKGNSK